MEEDKKQDGVRTGVLLVNMGSPEDPDEILPYLKNLFNDPRILEVPFGFFYRRLLASYIARKRAPESRRRYEKIGGSPMMDFCRTQAEQVGNYLLSSGGDWRVALAMRYTEPRAEFSVDALIEAGCRRIVVCPLYPHFCRVTTGSSYAEIRRILARRSPDTPVFFIESYHDDEGYLDVLESTVRDALGEIDPVYHTVTPVIFSAHNIPKRLLSRGDPYLDQVRSTCERLAERMDLRHWRLAFQSRTKMGRWLDPTTEDTLEMLHRMKARTAVMVPVSFTSDNVETLYDMDIVLTEKARALGIDLHRAPALNNRPAYAQALAEMIIAKVGETVKCEA